MFLISWTKRVIFDSNPMTVVSSSYWFLSVCKSSRALDSVLKFKFKIFKIVERAVFRSLYILLTKAKYYWFQIGWNSQNRFVLRRIESKLRAARASTGLSFNGHFLIKQLFYETCYLEKRDINNRIMKTPYLVNIKMDLEMSNLINLSNLNNKTNLANFVEEIFPFNISGTLNKQISIFDHQWKIYQKLLEIDSEWKRLRAKILGAQV